MTLIEIFDRSPIENLVSTIALEPELLIADEPTSMLDVSVQAQILSLIKDLQKRLDFAMLFISHDLDVVRAVSDRVIVIRHGVLIEEGGTEEVYEHPKQEYTRNLLDAFYYDKNATSPLYRVYNPNAISGAHHFTANKDEYDYLVSVGWRGEGIAWTVEHN